jgi:hypothetical protein
LSSAVPEASTIVNLPTFIRTSMNECAQWQALKLRPWPMVLAGWTVLLMVGLPGLFTIWLWMRLRAYGSLLIAAPLVLAVLFRQRPWKRYLRQREREQEAERLDRLRNPHLFRGR